MTVSSVTRTPPSQSAPSQSSAKTSLSALNSGDFLKLMLAQMEQQDPTAPVDQKEMLAQMAQFSSLSNSQQMADTLSTISAKLDTLVSAQATNSAAISQLAASVAGRPTTAS
ncbi:flagellar hook assembly protein FlgD [Novosphingobium colocasiae]|uniref:flagellar hook assembly protein FlgD n=1 Tax=Novosphingobium colocasiae TaxID=1256513 RepID=UPI0035B112C2